MTAQVVVTVRGGVAYTDTYGEVDTVQVDWDLFDDNHPSDEEIADFREEILKIRDEQIRDNFINELDEEVEKIRAYEDAERRRDEDTFARRLEAARKLVAENPE